MKTNSAILLSFLAACALPASAATITWQTPQDITGESDVENLGLVVTAVNVGSTSGVTVNGVTFGADDGKVTTNGTQRPDFAPSPDPSISANYHTLLDSIRTNGSNISISGLTSGTEYQVQIWVNDSRYPNTATRQTTFSAGNTSGYVQASRDDTQYHLGQFVIGTFTADGTTQTITYQGYNGDDPPTPLADANYVNALLVTTVPEPGSAAFLGLLLCGAGFLRRRK